MILLQNTVIFLFTYDSNVNVKRPDTELKAQWKPEFYIHPK